MCYKYSIGQPFVYPRNDLSYAGNFLRMMFATPCEEYGSQSGAGARDGSYSDPARRSRAERVDLHGTYRGLLRR
ncbi:hypothetical protein LNQ03_04635 [Klebsiella pneumoniae subsp. pneumoniae]|nr:hypothetical protein [Klebsiella pneumoniae subsp. pneumoniae]